jgi:sulfur-oxidizing protein SoxY
MQNHSSMSPLPPLPPSPPVVSAKSPTQPTRRKLLATSAALGTGLLVAQRAAAADLPEDLLAAIKAFTQGAPLREGRVTFEVASLIDNGNAVPILVSVTSPMTVAEHVTAIAVFNERNPQRDVVTAQFGPRSGRAELATRIRLATSQKLVAVARMSDGSFWSKTVDVIVTLAACIEGDA